MTRFNIFGPWIRTELWNDYRIHKNEHRLFGTKWQNDRCNNYLGWDIA